MERLSWLEEDNALLSERLAASTAERTAQEERRAVTEERRAAASAARARATPLVPQSVDTKLTLKPDAFSGKDADWPMWSLTMRAYLGAVSGRMLELLKKAEESEASLDRVDLDPGDDELDAQLYFILTMLLKES